jgi:NAD(P)-dependent dehydrogenase (short-subunit alcohol dehydrogenase family)
MNSNAAGGLDRERPASGRLAIVTGGARGLGYQMATALARDGHAIGILDILEEGPDSAQRLTDDFGVPAGFVHTDVRSPESVAAAFEELSGLGELSVIVTAAGLTINNDTVDVSLQEWRKVMDVNLDGTFLCLQEFGRRLLDARRAGSAIAVSSMSAFAVNYPQMQASYNASKAAVSQLVSSLAVEWAPQGIRVNAIAPGYMRTALTDALIQEKPDLYQAWLDRTPLGRIGEPEDLDALVSYLASDGSSFMTGQSVVIDGGYMAL